MIVATDSNSKLLLLRSFISSFIVFVINIVIFQRLLFYKPSSGNKQPKGWLYFQFHNAKKSGKPKTPKSGNTKEVYPSDSEDDDDDVPACVPLDELVLEGLKQELEPSIAWLVAYKSPHDTLMQHWAATVALRVQGKYGPNVNAETYSSVPAIKFDNDGAQTLELICCDFEHYCGYTKIWLPNQTMEEIFFAIKDNVKEFTSTENGAPCLPDEWKNFRGTVPRETLKLARLLLTLLKRLVFYY